MKKMPTTKTRKVQEMAPEYRFDYKKSETEPFCRSHERRAIGRHDRARCCEGVYLGRTGKQSITRFDFSHTRKESDGWQIT